MSNNVTVSQCSVHGKTMWRANISRSVTGKQVRKFFDDEASAFLWADQFIADIRERGTRGMDSGTGLSVAQAIDRFTVAQERKKQHAALVKFYLTKFRAMYGGIPIRSISPIDLEAFWARKNWSQNTKRQAFTYVRLFFNWSERYDLIDKNPANRVDPPKGTKPDRAILTVAQMKELLKLTESDAAMRGWLCLGGFAGLRTAEILSGKIQVAKDEVHVEDGKTGGRYVARMPAFGRYWPGQYVCMDERTFRRHREKLVESSSLPEWPDNCLRHSFASYHLAMWEDAGKTAYQLGHTSPQMVYKAYARAVPKAEAVKWWKV